MKSKDWLNENTRFIAERFPNCVTETEEGLKVDFELLQQELSGDVVTGSKERYRLEWPGKRQAMVNANLPTTKTLRPVREDSVDFDNTENLYIEGDNLEVLKILQESYLGKIKMIYIDPPYNTGKDFVYKDNFTQDSEEYKEESGQTDEYNRRLVSNPDTSGRYHSDWLSMMYPRLKLARNLLTKDGVIFISIDDNEVDNLRKLCDEIFGESNFITAICWKHTEQSKNDERFFSRQFNYHLCYCRNKSETPPFRFKRTQKDNKNYNNPDGDPRGPWRSGDVRSPNLRENLRFSLTAPDGTIIPPPANGWRWAQETLKAKILTGEVSFKPDNSGIIRKIYLANQTGRTPENLWQGPDFGTTRGANAELKELFGSLVPFDTPKPTALIKKMIEPFSEDQDFIVLDFFSGSATTGAAVMKFNAEEGGRRKFIQVQLPEKIVDVNSTDAKWRNICDVGRARLSLEGKKIKAETGADIDYGFKVYRVDESNMEDVYYQPQTLDQGGMDMFASNIKAGRTSEDLLTQVLLNWGLSLTLKTEKESIVGKEVFKVAGDSLFACFDDGLGESFAKAVAAEAPLRLVVKDSAFESDTAKVNVQQLLKQLSPNTELKVI